MSSFIMVRIVVFVTGCSDAGRNNDRHNIISIGVSNQDRRTDTYVGHLKTITRIGWVML